MKKEILCSIEYPNNYNNVIKIVFSKYNDYYIIYIYKNNVLFKAHKYEIEEYEFAASKFRTYIKTLYEAFK